MARELISKKAQQQINQNIGQGWDLTVTADKILITSKKKYYFYVCVSLPLIKDEKYFYENYVKNGRKDYSTYRFLFEPRWSQKKLKDIKKGNDLMRKLIDNLPKQYKLTHLTRNKQGSYFAQTEEEKKRVKQFEQRRDMIEKHIKEVPDFHTKNYSIFVRDNRHGFECVYYGDDKYIDLKKIENILKGE